MRDVDCAVQEATEVKQMFVPYVLANDTREFEKRTRPRKIELATTCNKEPVWMVRGIVNLDE